MSKFACFIDRCMGGLQFCEIQSQRCRDCKDYIEYCFKDNFHISNCSSYCKNILMKNDSSGVTNCTIPAEFYLSEHHHILIEVLLCFVIILFTVCVIFNKLQLIQFMQEIVGRVYPGSKSNGRTTEKKEMEPFVTHYPNIPYPVKQEPEITGVQDNMEDSMTTCGFNQHNQISNATKDDPSLCVSGHSETKQDHTMEKSRDMMYIP